MMERMVGGGGGHGCKAYVVASNQQAILHREDIVKRQTLKTWKLRTKGALRHLQKEVS